MDALVKNSLLRTALAALASLVLASGAIAAPNVAYPASVSGSAGLTVTITPGIISDGPISASIVPPLPAGLSISNVTGVISGTPVAASSTSHQVTISDRTGSTSASLRIEIAGGAPAVVYPPLVRGNAGGTLRVTPGVRVVGAPRFSVAPELPQGLTLDTATGVISGTPETALARSLYVVLMRDDAGSHVATFELEVLSRVVATIAGGPATTTGPTGSVPSIPIFPSRASGKVLVATSSSTALIRRAFTPRSATVGRLRPGVTVRVAEALRVGRTLRVRIVLPGPRPVTGWVDGTRLRTAVVSGRRWADLSARSVGR